MSVKRSIFFFPKYSKEATELQPSTLQAMQASGDNFTTHEALTW